MPVYFCSCCWTNPCNNLHKLSSHIRGISVWFVEQIMCFPYTLVQKRLCSLSAQMQSANWADPALNSLQNSWFMPKYNIFKYNKLVVIVIATIATVEGLMCHFQVNSNVEGFSRTWHFRYVTKHHYYLMPLQTQQVSIVSAKSCLLILWRLHLDHARMYATFESLPLCCCLFMWIASFHQTDCCTAWLAGMTWIWTVTWFGK